MRIEGIVVHGNIAALDRLRRDPDNRRSEGRWSFGMPREPNAVDFWRGFALITIFIDHVPGIVYTRFTLMNFSLSDAADLFVFLAGWSLRLMADGGGRGMPTRNVVLRLFGRALELYAAQVLITMIAIAMLALTAIELANPLLLEWHNAAAVFNDPVPTHIGLAVLTHQLGYFDILPLYVVLMLMAPLFAVIDRTAPRWVLPVSLAIYLAALAFRITLPTWPVSGTWFFNPLAWQLTFVLGFTIARPDVGIGAFARRHIFWIRIVALPIVIYAGTRDELRLVVGPDQCAGADAVLHPRQDLRDAAPADPVPGPGRGGLDRVPLYPLACRSAVAAPHSARIHWLIGNARAQFALRVLYRLVVKPDGADGALLLSRHCRHRHARGNCRNHRYGVHRMACQIASTHPTRLAVGAAILVALFAGTPARAQIVAPLAPVVPFSKTCQGGSAALAEESPLPNVAIALKERKVLRILAFGAAPGRVGVHGGYTALIESMLESALKGIDVIMINRGVSGELAANAATRMKNDVALERPDLVLWQVGTNDALAYVGVDEFTHIVKDQIDWLRRHKVDVVLVGLQFAPQMLRDSHYVEVRDQLRKLATEENVIVIRFYEAMQIINHVSGVASAPVADEFERNEAGYNCLAQYVARAITLGVFAKNMQRRPPPKPPK